MTGNREVIPSLVLLKAGQRKDKPRGTVSKTRGVDLLWKFILNALSRHGVGGFKHETSRRLQLRPLQLRHELLGSSNADMGSVAVATVYRDTSAAAVAVIATASQDSASCFGQSEMFLPPPILKLLL